MLGLAQTPLLEALAGKMQWHQARQAVLAENVANAQTPGYKPRDLKAYTFEEHLRGMAPAGPSTATTDRGHIVASSNGGPRGFGAVESGAFEITPDGNGVTLEDQMMKVTSNQMDYQAITTLYSRSLKLIRTALGRSA